MNQFRNQWKVGKYMKVLQYSFWSIGNSCCPVKTVVGKLEDLSGTYILKQKLPTKEDKCNDNCIYVKVP